MSEPFVGSEMNEELESSEQLETSARELNDMTHEPGSVIEGRMEAEHSEAIETSFTELANNQVTDSGEIQMPACDGSSRPTNETSRIDEASNTPVPVPMPSPSRESGDEVGSLPFPLPIDPPESIGGEEIGTLPTPLPIESPNMDSEIGIPVIELNITGEVPVSYDGGSAAVAVGGSLATINPRPIWMDPDPVLSDSSTDRSDPNEEAGLIGENG